MPFLQSPDTCRPSAPMSAGDCVHWLRLWAAAGAHQALALVNAHTARLMLPSRASTA